MLLTRLPLPLRGARLACIRHTASVNPELGSNSPYKRSKQNKFCYAPNLYIAIENKFFEKNLKKKIDLERRIAHRIHTNFSITY